MEMHMLQPFNKMCLQTVSCLNDMFHPHVQYVKPVDWFHQGATSAHAQYVIPYTFDWGGPLAFCWRHGGFGSCLGRCLVPNGYGALESTSRQNHQENCLTRCKVSKSFLHQKIV